MKKVIFGMIIGFVLSLGTTSFANTDILAKVFEVKLKVNGVEKQLQGNAYNINNSTYIPLREFGNLTGFDVTYKSDQQTIELSNVTNVTKEPEIQQATPATEIQTVENININPNAELEGKIPLRTLAKDYGFKISNVGNSTNISFNGEIIDTVNFNELDKNKKGSFNFKGTTIEMYVINGGIYVDKKILELI